MMAFFPWIFYKIKWHEPKSWNQGHHRRWEYEMRPRYIAMTILFLSLSWLFFIVGGIKGLIEAAQGMYKKQSWSSYHFILPPGEKPAKWAAYKKF